MLPVDELHVSLTWPGHGAASRLGSKTTGQKLRVIRLGGAFFLHF